MVKRLLKNNIIKVLSYTNKAANRNKYTKRAKRALKSSLLRTLASRDQQEIYNLTSFYPSINDYYWQLKNNNKSDPLISILLPTYNTPEEYLRECIESIIVQSYPNWELCIADDKSPDNTTVKIIKEYQAKDSRIKLIERKENGHISQATNSALEIASGEFVALMDHDDVLWPNAVYEIVEVIRKNKNVDFIYSDEDKIDGTGKIHSYPFLKPDFSPEFLESCNYITHFSCIRMSIMKKIGGFRKGYEGAQDWDLFIRISELTSNVIHVPKILYSWRIHEASTASDTDAKPYVYEAQRKLLEDHVERLGKRGTVETGIIKQHRTIKYEPNPGSSLSVVIRYKCSVNTRRLLLSLKSHSAGADIDIIYVTSKLINQTELGEFQTLIGDVQQKAIISGPNDYKKIASDAVGSSVLVLDDDMVMSSDDWACRLLADSQIDKVGFVFPVIIDQSGTIIRSAGIGIGYGELGYSNMLEGMPLDDNHYTRGLYAKSRRNVSTGNEAAFTIVTDTLLSIIDNQSDSDIVSLSIKLLKKGYRHIYNPYIRISTGAVLALPKRADLKADDKYLNPNFNHANPRMEVRA